MWSKIGRDEREQDFCLLHVDSTGGLWGLILSNGSAAANPHQSLC